MRLVPKLLFLVTEDWYFVSHRLALACAARDAGFDVVVATRCAGHARLIEREGIRVIPFELSRRSAHPFTFAREVLRVCRLYRQERPDILHHVALKPVMVGGLAARILGIRRVVSAIAGMGFLFVGEERAAGVRRLIERLLPASIGRGIAIVQNPEDQRILHGLGVASGQVRLIPGAGIDTKRFSVCPEPHGMPVVMLPSRLLWDKGVGEFALAARMLRGRARFVLVGEPDPGNPASVTEADISAWVKEDVVEWWGRREDMPTTLCAAHVICLPSSYREGLPKVLLEAMACGRPCITTDAPGCRDAVRHRDNGLLVPLKDANALAEAISRLLDDPGERARMGARGRERAIAEFSQERVNGATLAIYRELLS